jgi:hypothetical protein
MISDQPHDFRFVELFFVLDEYSSCICQLVVLMFAVEVLPVVEHGNRLGLGRFFGLTSSA